VCCPDNDERKARYKMLTESGVVLQNPDGSLEPVSPKNADKRLASMSVTQRALYQDI
jgi:epoxyqueuosine reductase